MNSSKRIDKNRFSKYASIQLIILLPIILTCCASPMRVAINNEHLKSSIYEAEIPKSDWKSYPKTLIHHGQVVNTMQDILFVKDCPGPQLIGIMRLNFISTSRKKEYLAEEVDPDTFEGWALYAINENFNRKTNKPKSIKLITHIETKLMEHDVINVEYETLESFFDNCQLRNETLRELRYRFVLINRRVWSESIPSLSAGPEIVALYYVSPIAEYDKGLSDFDRFVKTFHFVGNWRKH